MLVSPEGTWMLEDSAEFRAALGDPEPDYDGAAFAVKNLGFIKFQILDNSIIEIDLHPRNVEIPALLALQQQLLTSQIKLFRLKYFDDSWKSEIICSAELALARLSELCAPRFALSAKERFHVEPQDFSNLFQIEEGPLRLIAQKWRMSFGHFDRSVIPFAIKHQLFSLMVIAGIEVPGSDPVFRFIGDGFKWLETEYQFYGIGERIKNLPDKEYGGWLSEFYKSVATSGQPRYDIVTATIQTGPGKRKPYVTRYERLLLPWKTRSDEIFVSLSSKKLIEVDAAEAECPEWPSLSRVSAKSA
jgi:hypothetical protein